MVSGYPFISESTFLSSQLNPKQKGPCLPRIISTDLLSSSQGPVGGETKEWYDGFECGWSICWTSGKSRQSLVTTNDNHLDTPTTVFLVVWLSRIVPHPVLHPVLNCRPRIHLRVNIPVSVLVKEGEFFPSLWRYPFPLIFPVFRKTSLNMKKEI